MSIKVNEYTCEACGSKYSLRYDTTETDYTPDFCVFCSEEVEAGKPWEDIGIFDSDDEEEDYEE